MEAVILLLLSQSLRNGSTDEETGASAWMFCNRQAPTVGASHRVRGTEACLEGCWTLCPLSLHQE